MTNSATWYRCSSSRAESWPMCMIFCTHSLLAFCCTICVVVVHCASKQWLDTLKDLEQRYPSHQWDLNVTQLQQPIDPAYKPVLTDEDQTNIYDENLEQDLAPWRRRNLTTKALLDFVQQFKPGPSRRAIIIKDNNVFLPFQQKGMQECEKPCDKVMEELIAALKRYAQVMKFPDVIWYMNVGDVNICANDPQRKPCPAPVFSLHKLWDWQRDLDILVPVMHDTNVPLYNVPWEAKIDTAFFRGTFYCHSKTYAYAKDVCSRTHLARLSLNDTNLLDVGFIATYRLRASNGTYIDIPGRGVVPLAEHARFRYLLALDGITASNRLSKLLHTNSVVLKQKSPWIEWYYRSLVAGHHYISFWESHKNDIFQVLKNLRHKGRYLQEVARQGQMFAFKYTSPHARMLYWRQALTQYKQLFPDMDQVLNDMQLEMNQ